MEREESKFIDLEPAEIDGQPAFLSTFKAPLRDADGEVWGVLGYVRNVTEQQRLFAETESLYQASQAISVARSEYEVAKALVQHVDRTDLDRVVVALVTNTIEDQVEMEVKGVWDWAGREEQLAGKVFTAAQIPLIDTMGTQDFLVIDNFETSESIDGLSRETFKGWGVQSAAIIPINSGQHLYGWLLLESVEAPWEAAPEIRPYVSLVGQAAIVLESHRLLAEAQRRAYREQVIREITEKMRAATNLEELIEVTGQEIGQRLSLAHAVVELGIDPKVMQAANSSG
jgi:K+-sensing histidine kinase KdpD